MSEFKVGDRLRRIRGHNGNSHVGYIGVIKRIEDIEDDDEGPWLYFEDGEEGYAKSFRPEAVSPVKTRTIHEIVDGNYGLVHVSVYDEKRVQIGMGSFANAEELTEAIATLTAIRDALEANAK